MCPLFAIPSDHMIYHFLELKWAPTVLSETKMSTQKEMIDKKKLYTKSKNLETMRDGGNGRYDNKPHTCRQLPTTDKEIPL